MKTHQSLIVKLKKKKIGVTRDLFCVIAHVYEAYPKSIFPFEQFPEEERHCGERDNGAFVRPAADRKEIRPQSQRGGGTREAVGQAGPPICLPDRG